ncbi:unnamed protein product [Ceratitis capitata]|uniref:(Mediterranean fruit fly) hypothetical protein n=1 Tax=Ceratitis capitata TaxID=7213 RepID=A0A811UTS4_CERCA|nr:unnamed protein product [Ceratitis capitata]
MANSSNNGNQQQCSARNVQNNTMIITTVLTNTVRPSQSNCLPKIADVLPAKLSLQQLVTATTTDNDDSEQTILGTQGAAAAAAAKITTTNKLKNNELPALATGCPADGCNSFSLQEC